MLLAAASVLVARSALATDPAPTTAECITASESGQDLRRDGKLHDARARFAVCVAASCPGLIREDCAQRLDEITKVMPSVVFDVTDSAGNHVSGVKIAMDGQLVGGVGLAPGPAAELDPGEHTFAFEAAGLIRLEKRLLLVESVKQRREVIIMDRADATRTANPAPPPMGQAPTRAEGPPTLAWVSFGVGGAGLTLGVIAGLVAGGKHSTLEEVCNNPAATCPPAYAEDLDAFHTWRTISTIGYVVGALGVAGGATLWLTAPRARNGTATGLWLGPTSAGITGRF
jgi:hypothetical protein